MGDRINDLPVDHIVPSTDEKQILDSMFVPSAPRPTTSVRLNAESLQKAAPQIAVVDRVDRVDRVDYMEQEQALPVKNPLKQEIRSAILLAVLFIVCAMPHTDRFLSAMMPFLQHSPIACLACKAVLFMMIAYILLNREMLRAAPSITTTY